MSPSARVRPSDVLQIPPSFLLSHCDLKASTKKMGKLLVFEEPDAKTMATLLSRFAPKWKRDQKSFLDRDLFTFETAEGPLWILIRKSPKGPFSHSGSLEESTFSWFRDQAGPVMGLMKSSGASHIQVEFEKLSPQAERGFFVGLELAAYHYKNLIHNDSFAKFPKLSLVRKTASAENKQKLVDVVKDCALEGQSLNLTRHLVNVPPNFAHPQALATFVKKSFPKSASVKIEVWETARLEKEGMGLLLGVGQGSESAPCMIRICYRPSKAKGQKPRAAFVGKGVTFDTGGLDLKPSSAMRLMKKDMGGAAAVLGLAYHALTAELPLALDFYVGLAENSVDSRSMRPSDVLQARNGSLIEIHNTDAEGRLVLADVLDVAVTQPGNEEPECVIDVATLTGAIKTALGTEIGGLFSNHDELASQLLQAGTASGDLCWRMPLYSRYTSSFSSHFAECVNAVDGWGGPITAALFLEKFVRGKAWAHFDIYAWADKATGAISGGGGNAQGVPCLIEFLRRESLRSK